MNEMLTQLLTALFEGITKVSGADTSYVTISTTALTKGGAISSIFSAVQGLASALTIIYFCFELNTKWAFEGHDMNMKSLASPFLKLIASNYLIDHVDEIFGSNMINEANSFISGITVKGNPVKSDIEPAVLAGKLVAGAGIFMCLGLFVFTIILFIVQMIVKLVWNFKGLTFQIEFMFRVGASPLAIADCYNGLNSTAMRYFKGFFGLMIYGAALIAIPKVCTEIASDGFETAFNDLGNIVDDDGKIIAADGIWSFVKYCADCLVIPIAGLGAASAVKQVTREAAG